MAEPHVPTSWHALRRELTVGPPAVLTVGASDAGKSTLCAWLAANGTAAGAGCWLVDADVGQSHLGPPACVGCAAVGPNGVGEGAAFFVGDVSPRRVQAAMLGAFAEAVRLARRAGAETIIVDSTGWVSGPEAVSLKLAKAAVLGAAHIVLVEREDELRALRRAWRGLERFPVHELRCVPEVAPRSPDSRRARREALFRAHLEGAVECELDLRRVAASGSARLHLPRPEVSPGLLLGLSDAQGRLLSLGVLQELQASSGKLTCLCRPGGAAASEVRFGRLLLELGGTHTAAFDGAEPA